MNERTPAQVAATERLKALGHFQRVGRLGGVQNKLNHNFEHFSTIGRVGGHALLNKVGKAHYSRIGKMGKRVRKQEDDGTIT